MGIKRGRSVSVGDDLWEQFGEHVEGKPESRSERIRQLMEADMNGRIEIT